MASLCFFFFSLSFTLLSLTQTNSSFQFIKSCRLLDLLLRDYTFKSFGTHLPTGVSHAVHLPANFSGISLDIARFRCGSLRRYGARITEFRLPPATVVQPCQERAILVRQNLGHNWSSIYYSNYDLSGYELVSPVLGLLAYNGDDNFSNPYELGIVAGGKPITIDFSNVTRVSSIMRPLCASFGADGKVVLKNPVSPNLCAGNKQGHFAIVMEVPPSVPRRRSVISRWKVAVASSIGAALGAFLLALLLVAMFVKVKKKAMIEELERRAYEEEALQVSMVGHIRAATAVGTRTPPSMEHHCVHNYYRS